MPSLHFDPTASSNKVAFEKILDYIGKAKAAGGQILIGGTGQCSTPAGRDGILTCSPGDDSTGYFIQPTVVLTKDPKSVTMVEEIFGPVLTVGATVHSLLVLPSHKTRFTFSRTLNTTLPST